MHATPSHPRADEHLRLSLEAADTLGRRALRGLGYSEPDAATIAGHLVLNASSGYPFAGLPRILAIRDARERTQPTQALRVVQETPVSLQIDGGNQVAYVALTRAVDLVLDKLRASRICLMSMGHTWYAGRSFNYVEPLARAGYAAMLFMSGPPMVAPHGATRPLLGTNPMCFAFPAEPDPLIVDLGTSATMYGEVVLHALLGKQLPPDVGLGPDGQPTRDAARVLDGAILPLAGHKGYALSFAVQMMGLLGASVLPPAQRDGVGFLMVAYDPGLLCAPDDLRAATDALRERIAALPRAPGVDAIGIPSERSYRNRHTARTAGIEVDAAVVRALEDLAKAH